MIVLLYCRIYRSIVSIACSKCCWLVWINIGLVKHGILLTGSWRLKKMFYVSNLSFNAGRCASEQWLSDLLKIPGVRIISNPCCFHCCKPWSSLPSLAQTVDFTCPLAMLVLRHQWHFSVNVWDNSARDRLLVHYVCPPRLTGTVYCDFLRNVIPELLEDVDLQTRILWRFMHDGAPPHFHIAVRRFLNNVFLN